MTRYEEARGASDPVTRLKAHALTVAVAMVPAPYAVFFAVTRRLEIDAVVVMGPKGGDRLALDWLHSLAGLEPIDPFSPRRVADSRVSVLTLADVASESEPEPSRYRAYLKEIGVGDVACIYLRSAGAVVAGIALLRERGRPGFTGPEVAMLRRLHPLLEHAYVHAPRPELPAEHALAIAGLTPREAEVAQFVAIGATNAEVARALSMSLGTVKTHLTQIYTKLGLRSRTQLALLLRHDDG
jgi:DNA-binding CsgD family transcriptional regulator